MPMTGTTAIIVVGGAPPDPRVAGHVPLGTVIAADGGLDHAHALGLDVDLVVGDLDSVSPGALGAARAAGVPVHEHAVDKDATDTELALIAALAAGHRRIVLLSGGGDRLDHWLATLTALGHRRMATAEQVEAWFGAAHLQVLHGPGTAEVSGQAGGIVTLLPLLGDCRGVTTEGLRWPLVDATLERGTSRGVSNTLAGPSARVSLDDGVLYVISPDALGDPS